MVSNTRINKIGEDVAKRGGKITPEELELLQEFRTSFSKPLVNVFNIMRGLADTVHQSSIIAFRLKRIDTIIGGFKTLMQQLVFLVMIKNTNLVLN